LIDVIIQLRCEEVLINWINHIVLIDWWCFGNGTLVPQGFLVAALRRSLSSADSSSTTKQLCYLAQLNKLCILHEQIHTCTIKPVRSSTYLQRSCRTWRHSGRHLCYSTYKAASEEKSRADQPSLILMSSHWKLSPKWWTILYIYVYCICMNNKRGEE
jgi:hypothetical protein